MATLTVLERLPCELLEKIAFEVCRLTRHGPPRELMNLLLTSKHIYSAIGPSNDGFYADLFKMRFDWRAIERRWSVMKRVEDRREKKALLQSITEVQPPDEALEFDATRSFTRPTSPSDLPVSHSPWRPLTNKDYARELKRRCKVLSRIRTAVIDGAIPPSSSRPGTPRTSRLAAPGKLEVPEPDELTQNLWTCYLMLIENDTRNIDHLIKYALLRDYMKLFYDHSLLSEALNPGWPRQSPGRSLGLWIGWLGGDDLSQEDSKEATERFFVLKPYVFGAHMFDAFHAPWTVPSLPLTADEYPPANAPEIPFFADLRLRCNALMIEHMGRKIPLTPPILTHAAIFSFFHRVEQDPLAAAENNQGGAIFGQQVGGAGLNADNNSVKPSKAPRPVLESRVHDRDFARLASCIDPYSSLGLPRLFTRGDLTGSWEGRFSFFDFDSYREMLGGHMRSLYEGPFGDQPQVWRLEERVVRLKPGERAGGRGPVLNAGYEAGYQPPRLSTTSPLMNDSAPLPSIDRTTGQRIGSSTERRRRTSVEMDTSDSYDPISDDRGRPIKRSRSGMERVASFEEYDRDDESEYDDGDYEILLHGSGHSAWGTFLLKGRVRSWDGMFSITKEYTPDSRGRWLYRGYCIGNTLVGRWRDTHTPLDLNGYEGQFLMTRRA